MTNIPIGTLVRYKGKLWIKDSEKELISEDGSYIPFKTVDVVRELPKVGDYMTVIPSRFMKGHFPAYIGETLKVEEVRGKEIKLQGLYCRIDLFDMSSPKRWR